MTMTGLECVVQIQGDRSSSFPSKKGVRQGDALACLLFNLALAKAVRDSGIQTSGTIINRTVEQAAVNGESSYQAQFYNDLAVDTKLEFVRALSLIDRLDDSDESLALMQRMIAEAKDFLATTANSPASGPQNGYAPQSASDLIQQNHSQIARGHHVERNTRELSYSFGPARELSVIEQIDSESEGELEGVSLGSIPQEDIGFLLKSWSIKKDEKNLYLIGKKMDRKGNLLEADFVTKKVTSRTDNDLVKTLCGEYHLEDEIQDRENKIPAEVKQCFKRDPPFPKQWRKALNLWNSLEKQKPQNQNKKSKDKSPSNAPGNTAQPAQAKRGRPTKSNPKLETIIEDDKSSSMLSLPEKGSAAKDKNKKKEVKQPLKKEPKPAQEPSKTLKSVQKKVPPPDQKKVPPQDQKKIPPQDQKKIPPQDQKKIPPQDQKKVPPQGQKKAPQKDQKKFVSPTPKGAFSDSSDDSGSGFDDNESFQLPTSSMTPLTLLSSITEHSVQGRYTPPTSVYDLYSGSTPHSNSSLYDYEIGPKNANLVKRVTKAKSATQPAASKNGT